MSNYVDIWKKYENRKCMPLRVCDLNKGEICLKGDVFWKETMERVNCTLHRGPWVGKAVQSVTGTAAR